MLLPWKRRHRQRTSHQRTSGIPRVWHTASKSANFRLIAWSTSNLEFNSLRKLSRVHSAPARRKVSSLHNLIDVQNYFVMTLVRTLRTTRAICNKLVFSLINSYFFELLLFCIINNDKCNNKFEAIIILTREWLQYGDTMTNIVVVQFSDYVQTERDKRFNLTCLFRGPGEAVVTSDYIGAGYARSYRSRGRVLHREYDL